MGTHIARYLMATLNLLVGLLYTAVWFFIARQGEVHPAPGNHVPLLASYVMAIVLTIAPVIVAALLLRRRTVTAGLRGHFALANFGFLVLAFTAISFYSQHARPHLSSWDLNQLKWVASLIGLWFGTGLTLKLLLQNEAEQSAPLAQTAWDTEESQQQTMLPPAATLRLQTLAVPSEPVPLTLKTRA